MFKNPIKWNILLKDIPKPIKNKYVVVTLVFVFWMMFFDKNSMIAQFRLQSTLSDLQENKAYYEQEIQQIEQDDKELFTDDTKKEKFGREHYYMKKSDEDVFIIE